MSASVRTGIYVGVALVLAVVAVVTAPSHGTRAVYEDEGELFFPEFTDPAQAVSLEVFEVNEESAKYDIFKVERKNGVWVIPSHFDYPADAKDRMAAAAGLLIGLAKGPVRSDARADHAALGVVDPRDQEAELEGRGMLVRFGGEGDEVLAELIIGKKVEDRGDRRFVRIPEKRRTYTAKIPSELSIEFADWVETDLLKLSSWDIEKLVFDNYSVDEREGVVRPGEKLVLTKQDGSWTLEGLGEDEEVATEKLDTAGRSLDDLEIVDVRPKPEGLDALLATPSGLDLASARSLQRRGFFLGRDKLYSNEGDLLVTTKKGVRYTLRFGEIVYGSGEDAGSGEEEAGDGTEGEESEKKDDRPNRYLMVTAELAEDRFERPEGAEISSEEIGKRKEAMREIRKISDKIEAARTENEALPETLAEVIGDDEDLAKDPWDHPYGYEKVEGEETGFRVTSLGADGEPGGAGENADLTSDGTEKEDARLDAADAVRKWKDDVAEATKMVEELRSRFAPWYYVIEAKLFDELKLSRTDLVKPKEEEATDEGGDDGEEVSPPDDDAAPPDDATPPDDGAGEDEGGEEDGSGTDGGK